jgi:aminoglycoside phosphotransferase
VRVQGSRLAWQGLPAGVRQRIERRLDFRVRDAQDMPGGFTPGVAAIVRSTTGSSVFVKAISADVTPGGPEIYRREAAVSAALPAKVAAPRLLWWFDERGWVVLAFQVIPGHVPELRDKAQLETVLAACARMAELLDPAPVAVPSIEQAWGNDFDAWQRMHQRGHPEGLETYGQWLPDAVQRLARMEAGWREAAHGTALLHGDLRADNMILTPTGEVFVVDWPEACIGSSWVDLVTALPSFAMADVDAESIARSHPLTAEVAAGELNAVLAAIAGYFVSKSLLPSPPGLPTVRAFQRAQGRQALEWLRSRSIELRLQEPLN